MFIEFDNVWHVHADTDITSNGTIFATTKCGVRQVWNQTFVDQLPGGGEVACEACTAPPVVEEPAPKPKKSSSRRRR